MKLYLRCINNILMIKIQDIGYIKDIHFNSYKKISFLFDFDLII